MNLNMEKAGTVASKKELDIDWDYYKGQVDSCLAVPFIITVDRHKIDENCGHLYAENLNKETPIFYCDVEEHKIEYMAKRSKIINCLNCPQANIKNKKEASWH